VLFDCDCPSLIDTVTGLGVKLILALNCVPVVKTQRQAHNTPKHKAERACMRYTVHLLSFAVNAVTGPIKVHLSGTISERDKPWKAKLLTKAERDVLR
jgi:hypothetical protein